jgi:hypothetical protein
MGSFIRSQAGRVVDPARSSNHEIATAFNFKLQQTSPRYRLRLATFKDDIQSSPLSTATHIHPTIRNRHGLASRISHCCLPVLEQI